MELTRIRERIGGIRTKGSGPYRVKGQIPTQFMDPITYLHAAFSIGLLTEIFSSVVHDATWPNIYEQLHLRCFACLQSTCRSPLTHLRPANPLLRSTLLLVEAAG
ncbi:hypothetical protein EUGRSUZ_I00516 [Eucalyptus grandis]|uniref:Uncharacterized protein n=2 Tax=Eucalyptus grandis TaxID=71139 RepID=A0ACC3JBW3_EUCGR|nr:hypothetical protein EUGRSUZ_I00516 [Eucalyptus grandis]